MIVPDEFAKPVMFLCVNEDADDRGGTRKIPFATAFFVGIAIDKKTVMVFLVTARSAVEKSRNSGNLFIQLSEPNRGFYYIEVEQNSFVQNQSSDVAVLPMTNKYDALIARYGAIPFNTLADENYASEHHVSAGDAVFTAGLISENTDIEQCERVIRYGRIWSIPTDKISLGISEAGATMPVDAYLVETVPWDRQSGAPVFIKKESHQLFKVFGLVHGNYPIPSADLTQEQNARPVDPDAGLIAVIPAGAIIDALNDKDLVALRKMVRDSIYKKTAGRLPI